MQKFGIQYLMIALGVALDMAQGINNALQDGKISFLETLSIGGKAFPIAEVIRNRKALVDELRELDEAEKMQIQQFVKDKYNVPDDKVKQTVEKAIQLFVDLVDFSFEMSEIWEKK